MTVSSPRETFSTCGMRSVVSIDDVSLCTAEQLFSLADSLRTRPRALLAGRVLCTLFYEASTRTHCSFQAAMLRLGGTVVPVSASSSSVSKGETLEDMIRTLACYTDAIVIRHPEIGSAARAASVASVPVINAGDGAGEHPTQALLDLYTIHRELGPGIAGATVALAGDLCYGRTVHSLAVLLGRAGAARLLYYAPVPELTLPQYTRDKISVPQADVPSMEQAVADCDVLYVTRVQKERFTDMALYEQVRTAYCVTPELLEGAKQTMVVMHPLPRVTEISERVDSDPRAAYFRQVENGMYLRMALLAYTILGDAVFTE